MIDVLSNPSQPIIKITKYKAEQLLQVGGKYLD